MPELLLIRADASPAIGTGHVMRCLAFAEQWLGGGGSAHLLAASLPMPLEERARQLGVAVARHSHPPGSAEDAHETVSFASAQSAAWVMVDGYQFDAAFQKSLKSAGVKVLWVDDFANLPEYCADFVLNQNLGFSTAQYPNLAASVGLLAGCRYALLRREFLSWKTWQRVIPERAGHLLVTLGGSDPGNATLKVAQAVQLLGAEAPVTTLVTGASNPHWQSHVAILSGTPHRVLRNAGNMPELMAGADMAIAAGGTTTWELSFMGLPSLLLTLADNQVSNCVQLAAEGAALNLGWTQKLTVPEIADAIRTLAKDGVLRAQMSRAARRLVDGDGALRVWLHLHEQALELEPITAEHCQMIYEWANEPEVRAASFSSDPIAWESHVAWYNAQLGHDRNRFWLARDAAGEPVGQVRFAVEETRATISVSLPAAARGRNRGSLLIWRACRQLARELPQITAITAWIKPDNQASRRAFEKAGFEFAEASEMRGQPAVRYEWKAS